MRHRRSKSEQSTRAYQVIHGGQQKRRPQHHHGLSHVEGTSPLRSIYTYTVLLIPATVNGPHSASPRSSQKRFHHTHACVHTSPPRPALSLRPVFITSRLPSPWRCAHAHAPHFAICKDHKLVARDAHSVMRHPNRSASHMWVSGPVLRQMATESLLAGEGLYERGWGQAV